VSQDFGKGSKVAWNWGSGTGTGTVRERFTHELTRTIKGTEVTRKGEEDNPAYLIVQEDGDEVLKLGSELEAAQD
jgi:hypothetical protein